MLFLLLILTVAVLFILSLQIPVVKFQPRPETATANRKQPESLSVQRNEDRSDILVKAATDGQYHESTSTVSSEKVQEQVKYYPGNVFGMQSDRTKKMVVSGKPGKPIASDVTHDSVRLKWTKPREGAHYIVYYTVFYRCTKDPPDQWMHQETKTAEESATVSQLSEKCTYLFKVKPESKSGEFGLESDESALIQTKMRVPSQPGKPKSLNTTCYSITLEWSKPEQGANNITSYCILYRSHSDPPDKFNKHKVEGAEEKTTVSQLLEGTVYYFKVRAECPDNFGSESKISEPIATKMVIPSKPGKPIASDVTHDSVRLKWTKPREGAHYIVYYTVFYRCTKDPPDQWMHQETNTVEESATVSQLSEKCTYLFKVKPESKSGEFGLESDESGPIKTRESLIFRNVYPKLWNVRKKWYSIGVMLGLRISDLDAIRHDNNDKLEPCLEEMIKLWLKQIGATWEKLIDALGDETVGLYNLADSIASNNLSINSTEAKDDAFYDDIPFGEGFRCPQCGECSIDRYLKRECPKFKSSSDLAFPYLCTKDLTENEKLKLFSHLLDQTESIITEFTTLVDQVRHSFKQQGIDPEELTASINSICQRKSLSRSLSGSLDVKMVKSVIAIMCDLERQKYISFFNYHIIQYVVNTFGKDEDKSMLNGYETKFKEYCKRSVFEVPEAVFGPPPDDGQMLAFKVTDGVIESFPPISSYNPALDTSLATGFHTVEKSSKVLNLSLNDALTVQRNIAELLDINIGSLVFLGANKGCIELKFSAPNALLDRLKQQQNVKILTELHGFAALNSKGIYIMCGPPGKPHPTTVTGSSINLQWANPEYPGAHPIQYYCVLYKSLKDPSAKWRIVQSKAFKETLEITKLSRRDMPFIFKVQAVNPVGAGIPSEDSDPINLMQLPLIKSKDLSSKPGKPKALTITHNSIQLEWTKPEKGYESITSYTVLYHSQYNDHPHHWMEIRAASTEERVVVSQLFESATYLFQVQPECEDGLGLISDVSDPITTKVIMPSKPGKPKVTNITHNSVHLEWTRPKEGSHNITSYIILYRSDSAFDLTNKWIIWKTKFSEEKATLTKLSSGTIYYFKVKPESDLGFGSESDISEPICTTINLDWYGGYLRKQYLEELFTQQVSANKWLPSPTQKIFNLAIIKKERIQRGRVDDEFVHKTIRGQIDDILKKKCTIELKDIFKNIEGDRKVILIDGAPGSGKSTLTVHICQQWGRGELYSEFTVVILIQLRDPRIQTARKIAELLPAIDNTMAEQAAKEIIAVKGSGVLWILDGFDELPLQMRHDSIISTLIKPKFQQENPLSKTAVIITSRPVSSGDLWPVVSSRIEVLGFTTEERRLFFTECLNNDTKAVETLMERLSSNPSMEGSCYLPLNASIVAHLYLTDGSLPSTLYGIFSSLVQHCLSRYLHERQGISLELASFESLDGLPRELQTFFGQLCALAFNGAKDNKVTFSSSDIEALGCSGEICELGLLQAVPSIVSRGRSVYCYFVHLSIEEMLAAVHISRMPASEQISTIDSMFNDTRFSLVLQFYAAITKLRTSRPLLSLVPRLLRQSVPSSIYDLLRKVVQKKSKSLLILIFNCLYEAQDTALCKYIGELLRNNRSFFDKLSDSSTELNLDDVSLFPQDCLSIGYFMASITHNFKEKFSVSLRACSLGDTGIKILMQSLCRSLDPHSEITGHLYMNIYYNQMTGEGTSYIAEALRTTRALRMLDLTYNPIGDKGLQYIAEALITNTSLVELDLSGCSLRITEENGPTLTEMLQRNKTLRKLNLSYNEAVSDNAASFITEGFKKNTTLKTLNLSWCRFTDEDIRLIRRSTSTCKII